MGGVREIVGAGFVIVTDTSGAVTNGLVVADGGDGDGGGGGGSWVFMKGGEGSVRTSGYVSSSSTPSISTSSSSAFSNPASKLV